MGWELAGELVVVPVTREGLLAVIVGRGGLRGVQGRFSSMLDIASAA
jgi:hypothetical protein